MSYGQQTVQPSANNVPFHQQHNHQYKDQQHQHHNYQHQPQQSQSQSSDLSSHASNPVTTTITNHTQKQIQLNDKQNHHHHTAQNNTNNTHNKKNLNNNHKSQSKPHRSTRVFARGYNYHYQFGLGDKHNDNYTNNLIELKWCRNRHISYVCSGITHLCYLSFTDDYYFCGQIDKEKLGIIDNYNYKLNKEDDKLITNSVATPIYPNYYDENIKVQRIADGISSRHIIIISKDFNAYSMGNNDRGQLGLGHYRSTLSFNKIKYKLDDGDINDSLSSLKIIDASCGHSHSAFVAFPMYDSAETKQMKIILNNYNRRYNINNNKIYDIIIGYIQSSSSSPSSSSSKSKPAGRLYVSGCNGYGQLGLGNNLPTESINEFQLVHFPSAYNSPSIVQVSCGENNTICLDNRGRVYCFGDNYYGQSGSEMNHYENLYIPTKIEHFKIKYSTRIIKISSGKYHCCVLDQNGRIYCWGLGAYGQLGCNKLSKRIVLPLLCDSLTDKRIMDIRCGIYHTIALTNTGKLYCWGSNNYGQCLQNIKNENIISPTLADVDWSKLPPIYKVFCGYYSTIIITQQ